MTVKAVPPSFVIDPPAVTLQPGKDVEWILPEVADTGSDLKDILVNMDSALNPYIEYKEKKRTFIFTDDKK